MRQRVSRRYYASRGATAGSFVIAYLCTVIAGRPNQATHSKPGDRSLFLHVLLRLAGMKVEEYSACLEASTGKGRVCAE